MDIMNEKYSLLKNKVSLSKISPIPIRKIVLFFQISPLLFPMERKQHLSEPQEEERRHS